MCGGIAALWGVLSIGAGRRRACGDGDGAPVALGPRRWKCVRRAHDSHFDGEPSPHVPYYSGELPLAEESIRRSCRSAIGDDSRAGVLAGMEPSDRVSDSYRGTRSADVARGRARRSARSQGINRFFTSYEVTPTPKSRTAMAVPWLSA